MAKDFTNKRQPKKRKLTDEEIDATDLETVKGKTTKKKAPSVRFAVRMAEHIYNELDETASRLGVTKASIVLRAVSKELQDINGK